jgi:hypothetical protein
MGSAGPRRSRPPASSSATISMGARTVLRRCRQSWAGNGQRAECRAAIGKRMQSSTMAVGQVIRCPCSSRRTGDGKCDGKTHAMPGNKGRSGATGSGTLPRFAQPLTGISWSVDSNPTPSATKPQRLPLFRAFDALRMSVHRVVFSVSSLSDGKADGKTCAEDPLYISRS